MRKASGSIPRSMTLLDALARPSGNKLAHGVVTNWIGRSTPPWRSLEWRFLNEVSPEGHFENGTQLRFIMKYAYLTMTGNDVLKGKIANDTTEVKTWRWKRDKAMSKWVHYSHGEIVKTEMKTNTRYIRTITKLPIQRSLCTDMKLAKPLYDKPSRDPVIPLKERNREIVLDASPSTQLLRWYPVFRTSIPYYFSQAFITQQRNTWGHNISI